MGLHLRIGYWLCLRRIFCKEPKTRNRYLGLSVVLTGLFVLLVNSAYWLLVVLPILVARVAMEALYLQKSHVLRVFAGFIVVLISSVVAIVVSAPALAGVYEYSMQTFPRIAEHFQVLGDDRWLAEMFVRSFFDSGIVVGNIHGGALGSRNE